MLSGFPIKFGWNCDASEAIVFYKDLGLLTDTILKESPRPGVEVTRNVYGRCRDKIVPASVLVPASSYVTVANDPHHEVRV
jgi:hypothetical protein